jgi:accessory colonization factor AcfC
VVVATLGTILAKLGDTKLPHLYLIYAGDGLAVAGAPATRTENKATPGNQAACCNVGEKEQSPACSCTARSGATSSVSAGNSAASPGRIQVLTSGSLASAIGVMKQMFDRQEKVEVEVQPGRADELISLAAKTGAGDVLALVSDALMDRAELSGAIRPETRTLVGSSHTVLLVKKANPKGIRGLSDLGRPGVRVVVSTDTCLAGAWEDVVFKAGLDTAEAVSKNVVLRVPGCHFLMQALLEGKADVGLGWPFLAVLHPDKVQWVSLPPELEIRRGVCMAVTKGAKNPELAARFITYAKSRFGQAALAWWEGRAPSPSQAPQKKSEATTR